jgi:phosphoserine aminotransferase
MSAERAYNFSAGPAVLPQPVLEEARDNLLSLGGTGVGICEISHRSKEFAAIIEQAEADIRALLEVPEDYQVLFLQGGASLQFSMAPMNLLGEGRTADYILTGSWSKKALAEAEKIGDVHVAASTEEDHFRRIPSREEIRFSSSPAYVHFTSNNTIFGTQWADEPPCPGVPLVCDASSDILSRPLDIRKYGLIYAGAQKNLGPAGVTLVIIRSDLLGRSGDSLPTMMNYRKMAEGKSLYNTPPAFAVYVVGLVAKWVLKNGGLAEMHRRNQEKARLLYDAIDADAFFRPHAEVGSRSLMNVCWRLPSEELEARFVKEAGARNMRNLKGHRSVGGLRASIYNAFPKQGIEELVSFMKDFATRNG